MEDHYVMLVDENGRAYLAHGIKDRAHKYLVKITDGAKNRYLYTQQEVNAYLNRRKSDKYARGVMKDREKQGRQSLKDEAKARKQAEKDKAKYNKYAAEYASNVQTQRDKQGRQHVKQERKTQKEAEKQAKRDAKYRETTLKDYLTGGKEQEAYRKAKAELKEANEDLKGRKGNLFQDPVKGKGDVYIDALNKSAKTRRQVLNTGVDWFGEDKRAQEKTEKARADMYKSRERVKEAEKLVEDREREYEESSLPGQIHKLGRETSEGLQDLVEKVGGIKVRTRRQKPKESDGQKSGSSTRSR